MADMSGKLMNFMALMPDWLSSKLSWLGLTSRLGGPNGWDLKFRVIRVMEIRVDCFSVFAMVILIFAPGGAVNQESKSKAARAWLPHHRFFGTVGQR